MMNNNFGMNPMGINPNIMNNFGMNNQLNLMDNTALNIKNIILPYENKIRDLEEIIKQKDFEIIVLKQKLNNIPKNNLMNLNINLMNPMMDIMNQNMNMNIQPMMNQFNNRFFENKKITLSIQSDIADKAECFLDDKACILENTIKIMYNYKPIDCDKTIEENGIYDGSTIKVTNLYYILRFGFESGQINDIILDGDCPVKQAIKFVSQDFKGGNIYQMILNNKIYFVFNSIKLNFSDETPIKKIFSYNKTPYIKVLEFGNLIG